MFTTIKQIITLLKDDILKVYNADRKITLSAFSILKKDERTCSGNCLYVTTVRRLPDSVPEGLEALAVTATDGLPESYSGICTIVLRSEADPFRIMGLLQDTFPDEHSKNTFTNMLLEAINSGKTIQQLLDIGYQELGNPLLLVDAALCFVAHAGGSQITDEPLWDWTLSKGYVTEEYVRYVMNDENGPQNSQDDGAEWNDSRLIWQDGLLHHRQLVGKVTGNGTPLGYLKLLEYYKPITDEAAENLITLCEFIAILMNASAGAVSFDNTLVETFLTAMLTQRLYDKSAIEERVSRFGLKLYDNLSVIVVGTSGLIVDKIYFLKKKLKNFLTRDTIVLFKGNLVILYDHKMKEAFTENELVNFKNLCADFGVRAGISNAFTGVYCFETYYRQALTALELSIKIDSGESVAFYDDLCVLHMVSLFAEHNEPDVIVHPAVFQLHRHDVQYGSDFCNTLTEYLKNDGNPTLTASKLHIHYNTLKYRIRKLTELTGLDLTDNDLLFRLRLSFIIFDYLNKTGRFSAEPEDERRPQAGDQLHPAQPGQRKAGQLPERAT